MSHFERAIAAGLVLLAFVAVGSAAAAQEPTPAPETTATVVSIPLLTVDLGDNAITWEAIAGAQSTRISGRLTISRVSATLCGPLTQSERREIVLDETLSGSGTTFVLTLPPLPAGETWLVNYDTIVIEVLDSSGRVLSATRTARIVEGCMTAATPPPTTQLPSTGVGDAAGDAGAGRRYVWILTAGAGGLLLFAAAYRRIRA